MIFRSSIPGILPSLHDSGNARQQLTSRGGLRDSDRGPGDAFVVEKPRARCRPRSLRIARLSRAAGGPARLLRGSTSRAEGGARRCRPSAESSCEDPGVRCRLGVRASCGSRALARRPGVARMARTSDPPRRLPRHGRRGSTSSSWCGAQPGAESCGARPGAPRSAGGHRGRHSATPTDRLLIDQVSVFDLGEPGGVAVAKDTTQLGGHTRLTPMRHFGGARCSHVCFVICNRSQSAPASSGTSGNGDL